MYMYSSCAKCTIQLFGGLEHEFDFPFHIWDVILPIDELIFRGVGGPLSCTSQSSSIFQRQFLGQIDIFHPNLDELMNIDDHPSTCRARHGRFLWRHPFTTKIWSKMMVKLLSYDFNG